MKFTTWAILAAADMLNSSVETNINAKRQQIQSEKRIGDNKSIVLIFVKYFLL